MVNHPRMNPAKAARGLWWTPLIFLIPGCLYILMLPPQAAAISSLSGFPATFLSMPSVEVPATQMVLDDLRPSDILLRRYTRPDGEPLWLVIIFFQNARWGAHDPRLCYISQGYNLTNEKIEEIPLAANENLKVNLFQASRGDNQRSVLSWWYIPGAGTTTDQNTFRKLLMIEGMRHNSTYGAFVRISTTTAMDGSEMELLRAFSAGVAAQLPLLIQKG
ncbi:MAG: EpsI family protein [Candidatus Eisenbacteria bacterium]|uniref:EpsI family protein n=1 Tax=Eiseniibacteriota bacterium TaxID=2212470 RepID=A0A948RYV4_UNCEI|nr:EpsI family protein [Candidatus Eisenbacteria bacterium]MBU1949221.1 EpsI family protein [Candidatus Eisenbacteria bacterium]MBU2691662.1 EpsI family protein [Candidatus Eisenbacteria bacterium]